MKKLNLIKIEISGAEEDEENGQLKWKLNLKPLETKELLLKYAVKYPS